MSHETKAALIALAMVALGALIVWGVNGDDWNKLKESVKIEKLSKEMAQDELKYGDVCLNGIEYYRGHRTLAPVIEPATHTFVNCKGQEHWKAILKEKKK